MTDEVVSQVSATVNSKFAESIQHIQIDISMPLNRREESIQSLQTHRLRPCKLLFKHERGM